MKRLPILAITALVLAFGMLIGQPARAGGAADEAQARVKAFYAWYIPRNGNPGYPLLDKKIFDFVAKGTVDRLRNDYAHGRLPGDGDYFLKVQDEDDRDWLAHIATQPAVALGGVTVIPVTFGSTDKVSVLVFVRKIGGAWKITRVEDTADYE
jgi:hypothetical protein